MPSRQSVDAFIAHVLSEDHVGAIRDWYSDDAWMQENQAAAARGRARGADGAGGRPSLGRAESVKTELLGGPLIDGDNVALRWRFSFQWKDGGGMRMEEVAWQTWRGDKIAEETFFYDPGQRGR